jgi:hypothetical protein
MLERHDSSLRFTGWSPAVGYKSIVKDKKHINKVGVQKALEHRMKEMACESDHYCKIRGCHKADERERSLL